MLVKSKIYIETIKLWSKATAKLVWYQYWYNTATGTALVRHWYGTGTALVRHWYGTGTALVWYWYGDTKLEDHSQGCSTR